MSPRPVKTQMPPTPIPPTTGSRGAVRLITTLPLAYPAAPNRASNNPGSMTAPSAQGPLRPDTTAPSTRSVDPT